MFTWMSDYNLKDFRWIEEVSTVSFYTCVTIILQANPEAGIALRLVVQENETQQVKGLA